MAGVTALPTLQLQLYLHYNYKSIKVPVVSKVYATTICDQSTTTNDLFKLLDPTELKVQSQQFVCGDLFFKELFKS